MQISSICLLENSFGKPQLPALEVIKLRKASSLTDPREGTAVEPLQESFLF